MADFESRSDPLHQAAVWSMVSLSLAHALQLVTRRARIGQPVANSELQAIRDEVIASVKDSGITGVPIQDEAAILRQALENLEKLLDDVLSQ